MIFGFIEIITVKYFCISRKSYFYLLKYCLKTVLLLKNSVLLPQGLSCSFSFVDFLICCFPAAGALSDAILLLEALHKCFIIIGDD